MNELIEGFKLFKDLQGKKYTKNDKETKTKLYDFRKLLGKFTDNIFINNHDMLSKGRGLWQSSGNFLPYMWNKYKMEGDDSNLVIYFSASTKKDEGLFISIGLIDDKLTDFEATHKEDIYNLLEQECKKINCKGFHRKNVGWGERVFSIENEKNFESADYQCIVSELKQVYQKVIKNIYNTNQIKDVETTLKDVGRCIPLNQILYGPPGTGKTYNTINKALEIIFQNEDVDKEFEITSDDETNYFISYANAVEKENRSALIAIFDLFKKNKQIEFITFHQSYGYEEFVEGIRALAPESEHNDSNQVVYKVVNGIFKAICGRASRVAEQVVKFEGESIEFTKELLKEKYDSFVAKLPDQSEEASEFTLSTKTKSTFYLFKNSTPSIVVRTKDGQINMSVAFSKLARIYFDKEKPTYASYEPVILEKILEGISITDKEVKSSQHNYILIIDEINRGNISKIFGELITLIEPSKRIGADEAIQVRLPYSNKLFGVPKNLYIIGTMNTADRSIAQIDTALRRRFVFEEMMPDLALLAKKDYKLMEQDSLSYKNEKNDLYVETDEKGVKSSINVRLMVKAINERIEYYYDREHTIGHSYFLPLINIPTKEKLDEIFRINILPLLAEYFYGDWGDIQKILNNNFVDKKGKSPFIEGENNLKDVYYIQNEFVVGQYQKIYNGYVESPSENSEE